MRYILYFLFLISFRGFAQEVQIQFTIEDEMTETRIDSVDLSIYTSSGTKLLGQKLNNLKPISFTLPQNEMIEVRAYKKGFYQIDTLLNLSLYDKTIRRGRIIELHLVMKFDGQISGEYNVNATYKPKVAFASERISVSDFVVIDDQTQVLLAYPKKLSSGSELILFRNDSIVNSQIVPGKAVELITDYRNRIYLRCEYSDYMLKNLEDLQLVEVSRDQLDNYIRPILDTIRNEQLFFTTYKSHYPAFDFYKVQMEDSSHVLLHHIEDTEMMEMYRSEYKWADVRTKLWAWDMEASSGIDREIWVGANVFTNSIYYESPFSTFYLVGNNSFVFDFYKNKLFRYDAYTAKPIDSIAIEFHKDARKTGWEREMIQDPITKKVYTLYDDGGYMDVYEIDLKTGERKEKFTLFYRYVEEISIVDNKVYYIYRPFESLQKKYLYMEEFENPKRSLAGQKRFENK